MTTTIYPFVSRHQVIERLSKDDKQVVIEMLGLLHERHVTRDPHNRTTAMGWSCSDRLKGETLYERFSMGDVNDKDIARASSLLRRYSKQIARALRDTVIAQTTDPALLASAAVFGVGPFARTQASPAPKERAKRTRTTDDQASEAAENASQDPMTLSPTPPGVVRRRGRPPGAKNKAREPATETQTRATNDTNEGESSDRV